MEAEQVGEVEVRTCQLGKVVGQSTKGVTAQERQNIVGLCCDVRDECDNNATTSESFNHVSDSVSTCLCLSPEGDG